MTASYTTRIRLTKQGNGDNDSTWGTVLNDEVIDFTDFAIAGYTTISLAAGDVSLTSTDGSPDQARSAMLELSGTLGAAQKVYLPGVSKTYIVRNNTSGAYSATVLVNGGTGHAVPQGESAIIYCDAVSVREAATSLVTQFTSISTDVLTATSTTGTNAAYTGFVSATNITGASVSATNITGTNVSVTGTISGATLTLTNDLTVANGGTGASALTNHGVVLGQAAAAVAVTAAGTSGQVLTSNGASADPTFQTSSGSGLAKVWGHVDRSAGTPSLSSPSYNVTSVTDDGVGLTIITIATDFSSAVYAPVANLIGSGGVFSNVHTLAAGSFKVQAYTPGENPASYDTADFSFIAFGDQV